MIENKNKPTNFYGILLVNLMLRRTWASIKHVGLPLGVFIRYHTSYVIENESIEAAKNKLKKLLEQTKESELGGAVISHEWEKDKSNENIEYLRFTVQKAGTSSIEFLVKEHQEPFPYISVTEHSRKLSFFHSAFAHVINEGIDKMLTEKIGAKKKEE